MPGSIYPSIPMPGQDPSTYLPALEAMRQTLNLIILNGLSPNPNYTPSERAQVFTTYAALTKAGIMGPQGPQGEPGPPGPSGIPEAPNDANTYARHALGWRSIALQAAAASVPNVLTANSTTYYMQGLQVSINLGVTSRWLMSFSGSIANSVNNGETDATMFYGTGTPPRNGDPVTGTPVGSTIRFEAGTGGSIAPFSKTSLLQGLVPGTVYWFDLAMRVTVGTGTVRDLDFMIQGIW